VADALVALRAALEHALFAEAEFLDGAPLDEKAARLVEMPTSDTYEKFEVWKKKRVRNGPVSLQAGSELLRRVAGLQPFHRQLGPEMGWCSIRTMRSTGRLRSRRSAWLPCTATIRDLGRFTI
jgi:hypothetical protein